LVWLLWWSFGVRFLVGLDSEQLVVDGQIRDAFDRPCGGFGLEVFDCSAGLDRDNSRVGVVDRQRCADAGDDVVGVVVVSVQ